MTVAAMANDFHQSASRKCLTIPANFHINIEQLVVPCGLLSREATAVSPRRGTPLRRRSCLLFDQSRKTYGTVVGYFDMRRGAANAHRGNRCIDSHIACCCNRASDECEATLNQ